MTSSKKLLSCFTLLIIIFSCSKEKSRLLDNEWRLDTYLEHTDSTAVNLPEEKDYLLSFLGTNTYFFGLDIMSRCNGEVSTRRNRINFVDADCFDTLTYVNELLLEVGEFEVDEDRLFLTGEEGLRMEFSKY